MGCERLYSPRFSTIDLKYTEKKRETLMVEIKIEMGNTLMKNFLLFILVLVLFPVVSGRIGDGFYPEYHDGSVLTNEDKISYQKDAKDLVQHTKNSLNPSLSNASPNLPLTFNATSLNLSLRKVPTGPNPRISPTPPFPPHT